MTTKNEILNKDNNQVITKVELNNSNIFQLKMPSFEGYSLKTTCDDMQWHLRYDHLNLRSLDIVEAQEYGDWLATN